jgi:hypothetical protein
MAKYFNYFPKVPYYLDKEKKSLDLITNLTVKFKFNDTFKENTVIYYDYDIIDGETPEIIAHKLYGSTERHWIILFLNNIINPFKDWPLQYNSLIDFIEKKYITFANTNNNQTGLEWAQTNYKEYFVTEKKLIISTGQISENIKIITEEDYINFVNSNENYILSDNVHIEIIKTKDRISYYDYEIQKNEKKRTIKLLKKEFIPLIEDEFRNIL